MSSAILRPIVTVLFLGLLATPVVISRMGAQAKGGKADAGQALSRYGFVLQESSKAAGIDFVHQAPVLDAKLTHIMDEVSSMGAGVSVVDFDRDGWQDL